MVYLFYFRVKRLSTVPCLDVVYFRYVLWLTLIRRSLSGFQCLRCLAAHLWLAKKTLSPIRPNATRVEQAKNSQPPARTCTKNLLHCTKFALRNAHETAQTFTDSPLSRTDHMHRLTGPKSVHICTLSIFRTPTTLCATNGAMGVSNFKIQIGLVPASCALWTRVALWSVPRKVTIIQWSIPKRGFSYNVARSDDTINAPSAAPTAYWMQNAHFKRKCRRCAPPMDLRCPVDGNHCDANAKIYRKWCSAWPEAMYRAIFEPVQTATSMRIALSRTNNKCISNGSGWLPAAMLQTEMRIVVV